MKLLKWEPNIIPKFPNIIEKFFGKNEYNNVALKTDATAVPSIN